MVSLGSNRLATITADGAQMCLKEKQYSRYNSKTLYPTSKVFYAIDVYRMHIPIPYFGRKTSFKEIEMESLPKLAPSPALSPDVDSDMRHATSTSPEDASTASRKSGAVDVADTTMDNDTLSLPETPEDGSYMDHDDGAQEIPVPPGAPVSIDSTVVEPLPNSQQGYVSDIDVDIVHDTGVEPPQRETTEYPPNIPISTAPEESEHLCEKPTMPFQDALGAGDTDPLSGTSECSGIRSLDQDEPQVVDPTSNNPVPPVTADTQNPHNTMNVDGAARDNPSPLPQHRDEDTLGISEQRPLKRLPQHRNIAGLPENEVSLKYVESRYIKYSYLLGIGSSEAHCSAGAYSREL